MTDAEKILDAAEQVMNAERKMETEVRRRVASMAGVEPDLVTITWSRLQCIGRVTRQYTATALILPGEVTHG